MSESTGHDVEDQRPGAATRPRWVRAMAVRSSAYTVAILDGARVAIAMIAVLVLRFDGSVPTAQWQELWRYLPVVIFVQILANWRFGLYEQVWKHASVDEAIRVCGAAGVASVPLIAVDSFFAAPRVPISVVVFGLVLAMLLTGASRFQSRLAEALNRRNRQGAGPDVVVIGRSDTAARLIRGLRDDRTAESPRVVAVLSDDPTDHGRTLLGVPVLGGPGLLADLVAAKQVRYAIVALSPSTRDIMPAAVAAAEGAGIALKVVPLVAEVLSTSRLLRRMRDVKIDDLLGRQQVSTDLEAVRRLVAGRRVLITGAGGSIGSEIARQVAALDPAELVLLDHDETHLFDIATTLSAPCVQLLADVRDADVIHDAFAAHRPEVVFHAAAHKHVPLLEQHPSEAIRTNVGGTRNVLRAANSCGTTHLVSISTDKAVHPSNIMGASKWVGERLVATYAPVGARWCSVRFGNVLGSRGSVIPTFNRQIELGGPVTVTDPNMTRYFMSTSEAVQLVLQAAVFAEGSDVFMLDMGEPVNILGLAEKMIRLSGYAPHTEIPIEIVGARPGEKLEEELMAREESTVATAHPAIQRLITTHLDHEEFDEHVGKLIDVAERHDDELAAAQLRALASVSAGSEDDRGAEPWSRATT